MVLTVLFFLLTGRTDFVQPRPTLRAEAEEYPSARAEDQSSPRCDLGECSTLSLETTLPRTPDTKSSDENTQHLENKP